MFEDVLLEPEQEQLLIDLVEAHRSVSLQQRMPFLTRHVVGNDARAVVTHPGAPSGFRAHDSDFESLANVGLLLRTRFANAPAFAITPLGFRYYDYLHVRSGRPVDTVQQTMHSYINAEDFKKRFGEALAKWSQAEALLWSADSSSQGTTIGHLCREALQAFAHVLVISHAPPAVDPDRAHTVARLKAVIQARRDALGRSVAAVLDAIVVYWGTVSDLVQRQEHDSQAEGRPLTWQDARRVVLLTILVMSEVDRCLNQDIRA